MANNLTNKIEVRTLEKPKFKTGSMGKFVTGAFLLFFGVILMITIIGILPGIGLFIGGFMMMWFGLPTVDIECYACGSEVKARQDVKQAKCEHCNTINPVKWVKRKKK